MHAFRRVGGTEFRFNFAALACFALLLPCACGGTADGTTPAPPPDGSGTMAGGKEPEALAVERARVLSLLDEVSDVAPADLTERYPAAFESAPSYAEGALLGLPLLQASSLSLNEAELAALSGKGFVISDRQSFPSFAYGYQNIYMDDLPLYVSADSVLDAVHRSYDDILQSLESQVLIGELSALLNGMRERLASGVGSGLGQTVVEDSDVFLAVAASLATGKLQPPKVGGDAQRVSELVDVATKHDGWRQVSLFGVARDEDFSQYEPRGHYADDPALQQYFRAMMWLGRIDFRLLETQADGSRVFRRRQLQGVLLLNELVDSELKAHFDRIDSTLAAFVGEPDYMVLGQVPALLEALGVTSAAAVDGLSDEAIVSTLLSGGFGTQRISSHIMINGVEDGSTLPLSLSFALMGQRYVVDSHVFSNVVFDRAGGGAIKRMMPSPLDVGFAALGNNQAAQLLAPELERYPYSPDLAAMRVLVDDHPAEFWDKNLYNLWLGSLRAFNDVERSQLPPVARSEAWGRRLLGAQLASWAQLRHDTVLYAKQSYTGGASCEFPDAYVDPYPLVFARIQAYGELGEQLVQGLALTDQRGVALTQSLGEHFQRVADVGSRLREMAEYQRAGTELTAEMLSFVNQAVTVDPGCGDPAITGGWYQQLFFNPDTAPDFEPTIADVHTQPTDEAGAPVGRVLHVGTGMPRLLVVAVDTCSGPRVYAGLASSYFEHVSEDFQRLTDADWESVVQPGNPPDVSWQQDIVTR